MDYGLSTKEYAWNLIGHHKSCIRWAPSFLGLKDLVDVAFAVRETFAGNIQGV